MYELARAFRREMGFDFTQWPDPRDYDEGEPRGYLWTTEMYAPQTIAIGASSFSWEAWKDEPASWSMNWVWIHWFERRSGHLARAWPFFRARFGDFHISHPISPAMKTFLRKHNAGSRWESGWNLDAP